MILTQNMPPVGRTIFCLQMCPKRSVCKPVSGQNMRIVILGCRGIIRADYRWNDKANQLFMLEVNTQPGMTATSLVPEQARFLGMSGEELVNHLLEIAQCDD
jgi:hypothetical protein